MSGLLEIVFLWWRQNKEFSQLALKPNKIQHEKKDDQYVWRMALALLVFCSASLRREERK